MSEKQAQDAAAQQRIVSHMQADHHDSVSLPRLECRTLKDLQLYALYPKGDSDKRKTKKRQKEQDAALRILQKSKQSKRMQHLAKIHPN